jgi:hypothetical protein
MTKKKVSNKAPKPALRKGAVSRSYCPQPKEKPINISFEGLSGESGLTLNPESYYHTTINVSIRLDKSAVEKYIKKQLTIKDLNDMIKCRM